MNEETVNQEVQQTAQTGAQTGPETAAAPEKTFTQAQVDAIVGDRLAREREKYKDYEQLKADAEKRKDYDSVVQERDRLKAAATVRDIRDKVAEAAGIPAKLLTGQTEEDCRTQAEALKAWKGDSAYPETRDGGAPGSFSGGSTRDQFASWFQQT